MQLSIKVYEVNSPALSSLIVLIMDKNFRYIGDISTIYGISTLIKAIFSIENLSEEKTEKVRKYRLNIAYISVTDRNIGQLVGTE